jgi:hypothetical protein
MPELRKDQEGVTHFWRLVCVDCRVGHKAIFKTKKKEDPKHIEERYFIPAQEILTKEWNERYGCKQAANTEKRTT